ncbi:MAG: PEP-CTERM system histidine kinase PrsK [Rhodospirillaceae bacterium]|nr:PEP-CTERM system histidine kinase PrsK [Rhodospirillales bacterium]
MDLVFVTSHGMAALAFTGFAVLVALARNGGRHRLLAVAAGLASALWSASIAAALPPMVSLGLELLRNTSWLWLLWALLCAGGERTRSATSILSAGRFLPLAALAANFVPQLGSLVQIQMLVVPVLELLALENLLRATGQAGRWRLKYPFLGLGLIFAYDLVLYADRHLLGELDPTFFSARGFVNALATIPLTVGVARLKEWSGDWDIDIHASRKAALHSMALIASGLYLMTMGFIGFAIREVGGEWGGALQVTFMFAGLLIMAAVFASGRVMSWARVVIRKHFFSYKYDYREEWLRFIRMLSAGEAGSLSARVLRAMADLMDSPAGALWLKRSDAAYVPEIAWNYHGPRACEPLTSKLAGFLAQTGWVVELDELRADPALYQGLDTPDWLAAHNRAWLVVPLVHRTEMVGFLVLDRSRAPHRLDWEDRDLLKTTATHAAGALAEELMAEALREARRLEDFNRRFAFVIHDIKNVVGQMSLMLDNFRRFGDRADFRQEMVETIDNSVSRLRSLLERLSVERRQPAPPGRTDLTDLLNRLARQWRGTFPNVHTTIPVDAAMVTADEPALVSVLDNLVGNAAAAAGADGHVTLSLSRQAGEITVVVADDGPGMDLEFVNGELFRPLRTTTSTGWGIGAWQARHLVREMGGRLDVDSEPGRGTIVRVALPEQERAVP